MTVLTTIMSGYGYPGGWLHNELRGAGLVYFVQAFEMTGPVPGYFTVLSQTRPDKVAEVVSDIRRDVERAKQGKITADEFRTAIEQIVALHAQENTTIAEQARQAALDETLRPGLRLRQDVRPAHPGGDAGRRGRRGPQVSRQVAAGDHLAGEDGRAAGK